MTVEAGGYDGWGRILGAIVEGTYAATGEEFFSELVKYLATALGVQYAFVGESVQIPPREMRIRALWEGEGPGEPFTYDLDGTPCQNVIGNDAVFHPEGVQERFPRDTLLREKGVASYLGCRLDDDAGQPIGILVVMDDRPMSGTLFPQEVLKIFAGRAAAELRRIRAERSAREASATLASYIERSMDGIVVVDERGRVVDVNPAFCRMYGYDRAELTTMNLRHLASTDVQLFKEAQDHFDRVRRTGQSSGEVVNLRKDGSTIVLEINATALGEGRYLGMVRDVTDKKRAEEKARIAGEVLSSTSEGIVVTDADAKILNVNRAFTEVTGYGRDEVIGQTPAILRSGWQDQRFYEQMWQSLRETGCWEGEIWNRRKSGQIYPEYLVINSLRGDDGRVVNYIGVFSDITGRKQTEERLSFLAYHDPLTGVANRSLLHERIHRALVRARRKETKVALLFVDLDRFKAVNDTLGHDVGDQLLRSSAERLKALVREGDTIARLGGDEFLLVLEDVIRIEDVANVAEKLLARLGEPHHIGGREVFSTASLGICIHPGDGDDMQSLLKNAGAALQRAKELGRGRYQFYRGEFNAQALERLATENDLRRAVERNEVLLHYQPIVECETYRVVGMEALIRWQSPKHGLRSPGEFIPLAEESGLIVPLGQWVIRQACRQARLWHDAGRQIRVSVNLSPRQFREADLLSSLRDAMEESGCPGYCLEVEITEGVLMDNLEDARRTLEGLKDLGIRVSIDDFGTGYSSLSYLRRLPVDDLKIDRSFVSEVSEGNGSSAIVDSIINLASALGMGVVAEGVETEAQLEFLRTRSCPHFQGYLYSRPVSAIEADRLLAKGGPQGTASA